MPATPPNLLANGNIYPSRFIKVDPTDYPAGSGGFKCLQASTNEPVLAISQEGTNYPPVNDPAITVAGYAAVAGQTIRAYGEGEVCLLELGGTVVPGDRLKSDSNGKGIVAATSGGPSVQNVGAIALQGGASGEKIRVQVLILTPWAPA